MTPRERVEAIRRAAIACANDHGLLADANAKDEVARHAVGSKLFEALKSEGLKIIPNPDREA